MTTTAELKAHTKSDLTKMAKRLGISGGNAMLKDELVAAIAKASRAKARKRSAAKGGASKSGSQSAAGKGRAAPKAAGGSRSSATRQTASRGGKRSTAVTKSPASNKDSRKKKPASKGIAGKTAKGAPKKTATAKRSGAKSPKSAVRTVASAKPKKLARPKTDSKKSSVSSPKKPTSPRVLKQIRELQLQRDSDKNISFRPTMIRPPGAKEPVWEKEPQKDCIALFVRDSYWLQVSWDITRQAIERAKAAMAEKWHAANPVVRLLRLDDGGTTNTAETVERDIPIHGGLRNWYIDWTGEPATFRAMIGYLAGNRFHAICESNIVKTPAGGTAEDVDEHWSDMGPQSERIFALSGGYDAETETSEMKELFEERLHRSLGAPALAKLGAGVDTPFRRKDEFHFDMDIELVLYGSTVPDGYLTLNGEPITLREDGTFVLRMPFPDRRQVLPAVACSRDGSHQRTIVVAVERNTKVMEPLEKEKDTGE